MSTMPRTADSNVLSLLAKNAKRLMDAKGLSCRQWGAMSGVDHGIIARLLKENSEPSLSTLVKMCKAIDVSVDELLQESPRRSKVAS